MFNDIALSPSQKQIIFGGLLGDAYYNKKTNKIRFYHCQKQKEYLDWKYSFFNEEKSNIYQRIYDQGYISYYFEIKNKNEYSLLYDYLKHNLFANSGRKKISLKYLKNINEMGLAIWWMDDGSLCMHKGNRWGKLSTECFNYEEHILMKKYFLETWKIETDIKIEKNKYYFLRFNVTALKKLFSLIYPYVMQIDSMIYKIDMKYKNNVKLGIYENAYNAIQKYKNNLE